MIMPNKYLTEKETLIGAGAVVIKNCSSKRSLSKLWDEVKDNDSIYNFERFVLTLDMLFILGVLDFDENNELVLIPKN
ncbi:ABC-three component system middle component 6 [Methanobrevibacter filiformis]|nr:ABC-three component system middle component 6 [Methanobrevibacter filiformis]